MAEATHHDQARLDAIQAGLPPEVHDPALLAGYAAFAKRRARPELEEESKPKGKAKAKK
jgi:hypothetical protein